MLCLEMAVVKKLTIHLMGVSSYVMCNHTGACVFTETVICFSSLLKCITNCADILLLLPVCGFCDMPGFRFKALKSLIYVNQR